MEGIGKKYFVGMVLVAGNGESNQKLKKASIRPKIDLPSPENKGHIGVGCRLATCKPHRHSSVETGANAVDFRKPFGDG